MNLGIHVLALARAVIRRIAPVFTDEDGATAVEYGIMVALIAAVIVAVVATLGEQILTAFNKVVTELK